MRDVSLTTVKGGLNRLRTKGAALNDSLYDLLNGYVTTKKTINVRPGTVLEDTLPAGTVGLLAYDGSRHVFAEVSVGSIPSGYTLHVLRPANYVAQTLTKVHFAKPFLGFIYVAAEFSDGNIYHYWLRSGDTWVAATNYDFNDLVSPSVDNSFVYRASRAGDANVLWTANALRAVNDKVEPTEPNGFYFEVSQIYGTKALSGPTEPDWADAVEGELFFEYTDGTLTTPPALPPSTPLDRDVPSNTLDRYRRGRTIGGQIP